MIKSLSVIFPIYNENKRLKYCFDNIDKFNATSCIKNIEYMFEDNGSKDNSCILIEKFIRKRVKQKIKLLTKL